MASDEHTTKTPSFLDLPDTPPQDGTNVMESKETGAIPGPDVDFKARHTPGPWRVGNRHEALAGSNWPIFSGPEDVWTSQEGTAYHSEANARLIAAAPELLEALKGVCDQRGFDPPAHWLKAWDRARAAIAKAEGTDD